MPTKTKYRPLGTITVPALSLIYTFRQKPNGPWQNDTYGPYASYKRNLGTRSDLKYQTGNDGAFRPCTHDTDMYQANPINSVRCLWDNSAWVTGQLFPGVYLSGLQNLAHRTYYSQFTSAAMAINYKMNMVQWSALAQTALGNMMPSFGGQNSLVNFILELKDFKKLFQSLTTRFISKADVIRNILGFQWYDKPLKKASKMYLSYQFGWRPLLNDILEMYSALSGLNEKINLYIKEANTDLQKHFSILVSGSDSNQVTWSSGLQSPPGNSGSTAFKYQCRVTTAACEGVRYNATLRYRYPLPPELTSAGGRAKALLDSLGVAGDPAIIWNAIPFSFLVDWVVNVGSWLSKLRVDNIRFQTEIRDFCHSAVITGNVSYAIQWTNLGLSSKTNVQSYAMTDYQTTDTFRGRRYVRKKGIPDFLSAMQTSGLNSREFLLGGALLGANKK